jgi:hypothetical protein
MFYLYSIIFSFFVVAAQAMYNRAANNANFELSPSFIFSKKLLALITDPLLLGGLALFLGATAISFWMYTKYDFSNIQAATVPVILIITYVINRFFFDGSIGLANLIGFAVIVLGVFIATGAVF